MVPLNTKQMQAIGGEGFWDGFLCGAATSVAIGATFSPDPLSKLVLASVWTTAVGTCGSALH